VLDTGRALDIRSSRCSSGLQASDEWAEMWSCVRRTETNQVRCQLPS